MSFHYLRVTDGYGDSHFKVETPYDTLSSAIGAYRVALKEKIKLEKQEQIASDIEVFEEKLRSCLKVESKGTRMFLDDKLTTQDYDYSKSAPYLYYNSTSRQFVFDKKNFDQDNLNSRWYKIASYQQGDWVVHTSLLKTATKSILTDIRKKLKEKREILEEKIQELDRVLCQKAA